MKRNLWVLGVAVLTMIFAASCSDTDNLSSEDAGKVYTAVSTAVGEATGEVMSKLGSNMAKIKDDSGWVFGEDGSFTGTVTSAKGGTATVEGTGTVTEGAYDFSFTITFNDYVSADYSGGGDITLNGEVSYSYEGSQGSYKMVYSGSVTASGAVEGTATFDLTIELNGTTMTFSGTVGGQEVGGSYDY